jgi:hypothetical protein
MTAAGLAHLRYDAHEPLPAFRERQRHAYQAGKAAWRDARITAQALQLYEELVRFVGANRYAWVKEETLVLELRRSASTIKRWMQQLVDANLIRRERRFGATSLTYITAYDDAEPPALLESAVEADELSAADPAAAVLPETGDAEPGLPSPDTHEQSTAGSSDEPPPPGLFFGLISEPTISSSVSRESFKRQHVRISGDGIPAQIDITLNDAKPTTSMDRLEAEGVFDRDVLQELRWQPVAQVEQVIRYVACCRTRDDPRRPGLIVHLLRQGFASRPCGRHSPAADRPRSPGRCDHRGCSGQPVRAVLPADGLAIGIASAVQPTTSTSAANAAELDHIWQQVLTQLDALVEGPAYDTWLAPSRLLLLDDGEAVVGVPNVFARDELVRTYAAQVEAVLHQLRGRPIALQVIIGSSLYRL